MSTVTGGEFEPAGSQNIGEKIGFVQPHGGMLTPGNPGNKGGGRPPNAIRAKYRELLGKHAEVTAEVILETGNNRDKTGMLDHLAKYGLGEAQQVMKEEMMEAAVSAINEFFTDSETRNAFIARFCELLEQFA